MPKILVKKRAEILAEYRFSRKPIVNIGSSKSNDIVIHDKNVSEYHCAIMKKDNAYEIKDKNTLTGTKVNDRAVSEQVLQPGDVINIGLHTLELRFEAKDEKVQPGAAGGFVVASTSKVFNLLGVYGKFEGKRFEINPDGETYIGRENVSPKGILNDIVLSGDMTASKGHAKITCKDNLCHVMDIGSTGGIAVNGNKLGQLNEIALNTGDEIAIGRTIFRFVESDKEDYSFPKNHRIFMMKMRRPFIFFVNLAVIGAAAALMYIGAEGVMVLTGKSNKLDVDISRYWSPEENPIRTSQPDYDITASPAIGDINNTGINDIVYLNSAGQLYAWDGKKGSMLWKPVEIYNSGKTSPVICDMNGDGIKDIVVVSDTSMLYIIDGGTGGIIRREMLGGVISENSPAVGDIDGDGKPYVVVVSEEGMVHFIYGPGSETTMKKFTEFVDGPVYASPVIIQAKGISPLVVVASNNGKVYFFDGKTRNKRTIDLSEKTGKVNLIAGAPAVGDLDGDGVPEVVVQTNVPQYVSAIDITKFEVRWTYFVDPVPPAGLKHNASPVITDAQGDGKGDVVVLSANGFVYALKGNTGYPAGELLWKLEIPAPNRLIGSPALVDIDKNGRYDIVFGTEDGSLYFLRNSLGRKEFEIVANLRVSNAPITSSVVIGDVTGDGKLYVVYNNILNTVQILTTNVKSFKSELIWPAFLGNIYRSGQLLGQENVMKYYLFTGAGATLLLILLLTALALKRKKISKRPKVVYI